MSWESAPDDSPLLESYSRPESGLERFEAPGLGTLNALLLSREGRTDDEIRSAAQEAFSRLESLEEKLSKFRPESEISLLNSLGADRAVHVGPELLTILRASRQAWEITGGAFDPTIGRLMRAWGLVDMEGRVPDEAEIDSLLVTRGMDLVEVDDAQSTVRFTRPGVSIDLGAIGKGFIADRLAELLRDAEIASGAVLSGSSTIVAWGSPPEDERWRVDLVHPNDRGESVGEIAIEPGALSTSGIAERALRIGTETIGHILDPRTGRPIETISGATVWSESALVADVLSTTCFVLGSSALDASSSTETTCVASRLLDSIGASRGSILLLDNDESSWGGLRKRMWHLGEAGFRELAS